ncbi:MAG TPA: hypothetical protein VLG49_08305 [Rhabdochlamydiaceae bacterium]|nr:hypothetical protein [Rhabdochlamydiaceae bacterium]
MIERAANLKLKGVTGDIGAANVTRYVYSDISTFFSISFLFVEFF